MSEMQRHGEEPRPQEWKASGNPMPPPIQRYRAYYDSNMVDPNTGKDVYEPNVVLTIDGSNYYYEMKTDRAGRNLSEHLNRIFSDHAERIAGLEREVAEARLDRDKLRMAMVYAVNQTDSAISDTCSVDFLCEGGAEIAAFAKRLRDERDRAVSGYSCMEIERDTARSHLAEAVGLLEPIRDQLRAMNQSAAHAVSWVKPRSDTTTKRIDSITAFLARVGGA